MLRSFLLPLILLILAYGFWISPDFKEISAGVAIFLFGMLTLEEGFKSFSGGTLENILQKSTDKLHKSISFGFIATAIMQSSSLVSVLTISFIGAGLIGLTQGIGIILGANIGTTTGAWLMAGFGLKVKISAYAMPMLVFGIILIFQKAKALKGIGYILAGLGFLFLGIHYMKDGFEAFKASVDLASFAVDGFKGLMIFIGIGILATVVMQSSHATIVLILAALSVGQITYENALALTIGANIGTTITAVIGSLSSNIDGKRLAGAHFIFNIITAIIAIVFIDQLMSIVTIISDLLGIDKDNHTLRLAVFDSFFKIMGVIIFIPFVDKLVNFLQKTIILSKKDINGLQEDNAKYLNDSVLALPSTAMAAIKRETFHLYENAFEIISHGINVKRRNILSTMPIEQVIEENYSTSKIDIDDFYNRKVKGIYGEIIDFSARAQTNMTPEEIDQLFRLKLANKDIVEAIKDTKHLQKNLVLYSNDKNEYIRDEYKNMRKDLVVLLRSINTISTTQEEEKVLMLLSKVKLHAQKYDFISNGTLDNLIRNGLITNKMATSLMNDSSYAFDISKKLISMAEILYNRENNDLLIDDEDVHKILNKKDV
ncbi:Na/Pi symporter [Poseidonibacter lekithochrous]|uniref:Na/Pi cotransporter family protein n=1 Tax=Poseidonibacter TaxID=2321187 RepID=UPI001C083C73|nr:MULTISPECIES: Na/Pi symporter [Poseidonibacter]MBU3015281.1 Na/Pi symporter [Poseidonibacter lekithochrous]MDO6828579.1 Na/Pi symporter [Poseidonibacter sp. 1_MG-2023]